MDGNHIGFISAIILIMCFGLLLTSKASDKVYVNIESMKPGDSFIKELYINEDTEKIVFFSNLTSGDINFYENLRYELIYGEKIIGSGKFRNQLVDEMSFTNTGNNKLILSVTFPNDSGIEYSNKNARFVFHIKYHSNGFINIFNGELVFILLMSISSIVIKYKRYNTIK